MTGDQGAALADEPFDPGLETGYLRRGPRERDLPLEAGAAPFDPGPEIGYDQKRAKRAAKRRGRFQTAEGPEAAAGAAPADPELEEAGLDEAEPADEDRVDGLEALERQREHRKELARERHQRELEERRARLEREREELEVRARQTEEERRREVRERRERAERELEERRREELERRARLEEQREREASEEREGRRRAREERREQWRRENEGIAGGRRRRAQRQEARLEARRRRRAKRQLALSRQGASARPTTSSREVAAPRRAPAPRARAPRGYARSASATRRTPPRRGQLAAPTAKVGMALSAVVATGTLLGAALGLPVPVVTSDDNLAASISGAVGLDGSGTPTALTKGPYFPVVLDGPADYGESAAKFGANRGGRRHEGQDIFAKPGTLLVAVRDGVVLDGGGGKSFYAYGGGNALVIYSALDNRSYVYLHMLKPPPLSAGDTVRAGQIVGQVGCTGSCDGPHLHFEVRRGRVAYGADTKPLDPAPLLRQWPQASLD
jgi:murein DD-endopeptidase MepM/ murein hydrolase activator NlpD